MVTLCSQVRTAVNAVACVVYFQPPAHARNMRLDGRGRWLLTDQVAEEQEESVPSQRREQHWVGWRMGGGVSVAMFGWLYLLWLALVSSVQGRA